jgi:hypothetical protein
MITESDLVISYVLIGRNINTVCLIRYNLMPKLSLLLPYIFRVPGIHKLLKKIYHQTYGGFTSLGRVLNHLLCWNEVIISKLALARRAGIERYVTGAYMESLLDSC